MGRIQWVIYDLWEKYGGWGDGCIDGVLSTITTGVMFRIERMRRHVCEFEWDGALNDGVWGVERAKMKTEIKQQPEQRRYKQYNGLAIEKGQM